MKKPFTILSLLTIISFVTSSSTFAQTTKTVGTAGDYATLNAAFADVGNGTLTGDIVFEIISDITETNSSSIYGSGYLSSDYNSITLKPTGESRTIYADFTEPIIKIWGSGNNITFDGRIDGIGSENQLTIRNNSGSAFYIYSFSNVDNINIKYCNISGNGNETIRLYAEDGTITNTAIDNCSIGSESLVVTNAIRSHSTGTGTITATVSSCNIFNFWNATNSSKGIYLESGNVGWAISNNSFYQTVARTAFNANTHYGIYIDGGNEHTITNNYIGGAEPQCGGTAWTINGDYANKFVGIYLNVGSTTPASVNGNVISNFNHTFYSHVSVTTLPGIWSGIYLNGGNANIGIETGNIIGTQTGTNNIIVNTESDPEAANPANAATFGIGINSAGSTVNVSNNQIGGFTLNTTLTTNGHSFVGIQNSADTDITIDNNTIGSTTTANSIVSTNPNESEDNEQNVRGIENTANATVTISNNTIANLANNCLGKGNSVGIFSNNGVNNICGNTISHLSCSSRYNYYSQYHTLIGISISSNLDEQLISKNIIHSLSNSNKTRTYGFIYATGICFLYGSGTISQNLVYNITFEEQQRIIFGLYSVSNATITNNTIQLGYEYSLSNPLIGIYSYGGNRILGNSVYITGTPTGEDNHFSTYAYCIEGNGTDEVKNNIFLNNRTFDTYSHHFAIGKSTGSTLESNHNNLLTTDPTAIVSYQVYNHIYDDFNYSFAEWQAASGNDANSLSVDPQFMEADDAIPDLHISASSPMINMGTSVYPLVVDIDDDIRDQLPDIGCDEFYTGSVVVGEGQTYTTLKQAFDAINDGTITGNISINFQSSTTETATATLYESGYNGTSDYTSVSIGTVTENITISGNIAAPIISFNGAHNVNMVDLAIENENTDGYCIQFTNSANNNRIAGCNLLGDTQLSDKGLITFDVAGSGTGNNNNTIESCNFGNGASNYQFGVVSAGTAGVGNNDNTITESKIFNFWSNSNSSAGIYLDENNANWNITDNHLYQTETITATGGNEHFGILSLTSNSINISNNYIGGTSEECGGTAWTVNGSYANSFTGISISGENADESNVSGNTISSFSWTAAPEANMYEGLGVWTAIAYGGGIIDITNNTIASATSTNNIAVETAAGFHVASYGIKGGVDGANVNISGNELNGIDVTCISVDYSHIFVGIQNDGATEVNISSNIIKNLKASTECTHTATGQHVAGIVNNANTTICTIDNNSIDDLYNATRSSWSSDSGSPFGHTVLGIAITDGANTITNNDISTLHTSSIDARTEVVRGISLVSDKAGQEIRANTLWGFVSNNNLDNSNLTGIWYDGPVDGNNLVISNKIRSIISAEFDGLASTIKGIHIEDGVATDFVNNVISLGQTAGHEIIGIYTSKNGNFYHNSVNIGGDVSGSLDANTYAFRINLNTSTAVVKNNIFVNTRTNSASGKNYAALCQGTIELDYNAYWVDGTGTVLGNDGTVDKTDLPIVAGQDANSVNTEIIFTNIEYADLSTTTAAVNAAADASVGVSTDYEGNTRNPEYPDMGAYEFTQPIINDPGASLDFGWSDVLTPTAPQSYQIVGIDLSNNLVVTAPEHFQVSLSSDDGFAQSVSVPRTNSNVDATIYARFLPDYLPDVGYLHHGDITNSASGQEVTVHVQGSARAIEPIVETGLTTDITTETATANAEVLHTGGQNVTRRGIIYWPYDGVDKEIGDAGILNEQETGSFGAEEYSIVIAGLGINTHYNYRGHAYNAETGYGETAEFWTLASVPNTPDASNITTSTLDITFEDNSNPEITEFAIHETTTNRFVQLDGTMGTTPVWQTKAEWGTTIVTLFDAQSRTGNKSYSFELKARNGAGEETNYGDATDILTLANTPNPTHLYSPTETTINISVYSNANDYSNNTANTLYAIRENNLQQYVHTNGTFGDVIEWNTRDSWAITLTGLSPATEYSFSSIAKNDDGIETDYSTPATLYTNAAIPNAPVVTILNEAQLEVEIAADDNPTDIEYCIKIGAFSNNHYVGNDGAITYSPAWQTKAQWEQTNITAIAPNTAFYLTAKARNGAGTVTDASAQVDGTTTAQAPPAPQIASSLITSNSFSLWYIYLGNNPENTELAIQDETSGRFVQPDGTFADTPAWQTKASWDQTEVQAQAATQYSIRVKARNANAIETTLGEPSEVWTKPYAPGVTLTNITSSSIDAAIDAKGNPSGVEYAINTLNTNKWVQADGTLGDEAFWQTLEDWGSITITGLSPDAEYGVVAYARANAEQSVYNIDEQANARTHANIPEVPTFSDISQNSLKITVNGNNNPATVLYAVYETTTEMYVGANGSWSTTPYWYNIQYMTSIPVDGLLPITQYTFKVKARNSDEVETGFGPEASVTTLDGPPANPTLISPVDGAQDQPNTILFEWEGISNAQNYSIQISENQYFADLTFEEEAITNTSVEVNDLPNSKTLYWRVNAANEHGTSTWSQVWSFSTQAGPPEPPTLLFPSNGEADIEPAKPFPFRWNIPEHSDGFTIEISTEPDFSSLELDSTYSLASWNEPHYFYLDKISHNTTYYWRVKAWNEHGESLWTDEHWFSVKDKTPDTPTLTSPANGLTDKEVQNVNFEWEPANEAEWYELQVANSSSFEPLLVDEKDYAQTVFTLYELDESTTYYWKVRSANQWAVSGWSDTWNFTTVNGTGVPTISENDVTVYPNPATDIIKINGIDSKFRVEVISELGVKLIDKEITGNKINIGNLTPGVYILRIETNHGTAVKQFVKQ